MAVQYVFGKRTVRQLIDGFVDNTSLFTSLISTLIERNDVEQLTSRLRLDMIAWKELPEASGGKLDITKFFYYILTWEFDNKGNPIPTTISEQRETTDQITIRDTFTNITITIQQREVDEAHKTLGCNEAAEIKFLKTRSDSLANMIRNYGLTHKQARLAYSLVHISSLKHGLPSISLSYQQITEIHQYAVIN
jgi:hypothetical protein